MSRQRRTDPVASGAGSEDHQGSGITLSLSRRAYRRVMLRTEPFDALLWTALVLGYPLGWAA
jgi:hypothetical protein